MFQIDGMMNNPGWAGLNLRVLTGKRIGLENMIILFNTYIDKRKICRQKKRGMIESSLWVRLGSSVHHVLLRVTTSITK
jgi:hypothetical protein